MKSFPRRKKETSTYKLSRSSAVDKTRRRRDLLRLEGGGNVGSSLQLGEIYFVACPLR